MYRVTLEKGKTFSFGKYSFDIRDNKSQIVPDEFVGFFKKSKKFRLEKIDDYKIESEKSSIIKPVVIKSSVLKPTESKNIVESKMYIIADHLSEAEGYGKLIGGLSKKYPDILNKDNLDLENIVLENYTIQVNSPDNFKCLTNCKKRIGFTMFETTKIPKDWPEIIKKTCDILIVPAKEVKKVFKDCKVDIPIRVVPLWADDCYKYFKRPKRSIFTFLFVGTIDTYNRKGWYELAKAFKEEFKEKNVRLIIKCLDLNIHEAMVEKILDDRRIKFIKDKYSNSQLYELYKKADCFVFPTHGEGFGLSPLEAMSTGLPTIVTDWMGCKEFVDSKYCYPLKVDKSEEALFPEDYGDVGDWAYINVKELRKQMRYVYEHQKEAKEKGKLAAKTVNKKFRFKHFIDKLEKVIELSNKIIKKSKSTLKLNLICEGLTFGYTGFAEAMRNLAYSLYNKDCNIAIRPHDKFELEGPDCIISASVDILNTKKGRILDSLKNVAYDNNYKTVHITMTIPLGVTRNKNAYQVGYVMFETQETPGIFINSLMENTDELWVPSNFNFKSFTKAGYSKPIFVMPLGVDINRFNPDKVESLNLGLKDKFVFLSVMGWSERKGISILTKAYLQEFNKDENTVLYLKGGWYEYEKAKNEIAKIISEVDRENYPEIKLDFKLYSNDLLPRLYKSADCFVLASLGEGWGLNCTEAMAMGLPTIATRNTSLVDFMNDKNSFLIDVEEYRPEPGCDWICGNYIGESFAIPSIEHLQKLMRQVYENKKLAKRRGNQARKDMVSKYQWKYSADRWFSRLKELENII